LEDLARSVARIAATVAVVLASLATPHPHGIWYFGHCPQWLFAIDAGGLYIGPSENPMMLSLVPFLVVKMIVICVPIWLIWWFVSRRKRIGPAA
jgi:hypothetical protein